MPRRLKQYLFFCLFLPSIGWAELPVIKMIATGGTIAMKVDPQTNAPVPAITGEDLLSTVPEIRKLARVEVDNLFNIPSDHMTPDHWLVIHKAVQKAVDRKEVAGVIISHGTDTLEETAYFLDLTINSTKPIVLIGAQRNASEKDFDGPRNLYNAVRVVAAPEAKGKGVMIVMNHQINAAREATKSHTSDVESFKSGDYGFLGRVNADRVLFYRQSLRRQHIRLRDQTLSKVNIISMYAGADGSLVDAAVRAETKGIVIQAFGMGNVNPPVFDAIKKALRHNIPVVISTRVPHGDVAPIYGFEGGGKTLLDAGAIFAGDLSPQKSRILLMLVLQAGVSPQGIQAYFDR